MDSAVLWLVLWFVFAFAGAGFIYAVLAGLGVFLVSQTERIGWSVLVPAGWVLGVAWFVFAAIQAILQIVSVVQLASG